MTLHIIDPGLVGTFGHHYLIHRGLKEASDEPVRSYCFAKADIDALEGINPVPVLWDWMYYRRSGHVLHGSLENYLWHQNRIHYALMEARPEVDALTDTVLLYSPTAAVVTGVAAWYQRAFWKEMEARPQVPNTVLMLGFPWIRDEAGFTQDAVYWSHALACLKDVCGEKLKIFTQTIPMQRDFQEITGSAIGIINSPVYASSYPVREGRSAKPVIGFLGHANPVKGLDRLLEVIPNVTADVEFLIHVNPKQHYQEKIESFGLHKDSRVTFHYGDLGAETYLNLLSAMDIVCLPYDGAHYRDCTSGVLEEAICLGKLVVVPEQTALAHRAKGEAKGCVTFGADGFLEALERAISLYEIDSFDGAAERLKSARERYSPKAFLSRIKA